MNILAIGIHPDDIELGCGGTISRATAHGHAVTLVDLTDGAASSNGTPLERVNEAAAAAKILGVSERVNLGFPDTGVRSEDPAQLDAIVACIRSHKPSLVFVPDENDPHPDHSAGARLISRALYLSGVAGFGDKSGPWRPRHALVYLGRNEFEPHLVVDITDTFETKQRAIEAHASQFGGSKGSVETPLNRPDFLPFIESRARLYGFKIGVRYGEPFRSTTPLAVLDLRVFDS